MVGESVAELLAHEFGHIRELEQASKERLAQIEGIGPERAESIQQFFQSKSGKKLVDDLDIEFLAAPATSQAQPSSADMLGSARMAELLAAAKAEYNYIVVDLPPTAPIADAR